jgi:phosphopentomutase
MNNGRVLILLLDSFGIGSSEDSIEFGDVGANTFLNIAKFCAEGKANNNLRSGKLKLPNLEKKGLFHAARESAKRCTVEFQLNEHECIDSAYGYAIERSKGKDTSSGHWEIAGAPVLSDWYYFKSTESQESCFPEIFINKLINVSKETQGFYDAGHASGTEVINRLGDDHIKTLKPIIYTSADSVLQIAAHEDYFTLERLYTLCEVARSLLDDMGMNVARVIARPFNGNKAGNYKRTSNRHDYSVLPPDQTLLDKIKEQNGSVISVGKIADIFADQGITKKVKGFGIPELFNKSIEEFVKAKPGSLVFTNFVDFDSEYGHRRDVVGYAQALEYFDTRLPEIDGILSENDMVVITADHGCDPTWEGSDHTREHIPFLYWGKGISPGFIGARDSFSDIGQTIADFLELEPLRYGKSSLRERFLKNSYKVGE